MFKRTSSLSIGIVSSFTLIVLVMAMGSIASADPLIDFGLRENCHPLDLTIGVDVTSSRCPTGRSEDLKKEYLLLEDMISQLNYDDIFRVYLITGRSEDIPVQLLEGKMPGPEEPLRRQKLRRAKEDLLNSLHLSWREKLEPILKQSELVQESDFVGFFRFIIQRPESPDNQWQKVIMVAGDLLQVSESGGVFLNFEARPPSHKDFESVAKDGLPQLHGYKIAVVGCGAPLNGAVSINTAHWRKTMSWWRDFFKACGSSTATISPERRVDLNSMR